MRTAAFLGNTAGGEVVRRLGTATLSLAELEQAVNRAPPYPSGATL